MNASSARGPTYLVLGGDGKEYGPVTLGDIVAWVKQKRLNAQSSLKRSDYSDWRMAAEFPELRGAFGHPTGVESCSTPAVFANADLDSEAATNPQVRSGASWFFWIAGLSLVNSVLSLAGLEWGFILGLGITQLFDAIGATLGPVGKIIALGMDLVAVVVLIVFGVLASRAKTWAFITGMVLYALDALLFLLVMDVLGLAFHGLALFFLYRGLSACRELNNAG